MDWSVAASIATVIAGMAVVVTARIYYHQLTAMTKARELESLLVIMRYADDIRLRRARYFMLEHGASLVESFAKPFSWPTRNELDAAVRKLSANEVSIHDIDLSLNAINNICFLVRSGYAPSSAIDGFLQNTIRHAWRAFEGYVRHRRTRDDIPEPSRYAEHLEWVMTNKMGSSTGAPTAAAQSVKHDAG